MWLAGWPLVFYSELCRFNSKTTGDIQTTGVMRGDALDQYVVVMVCDGGLRGGVLGQ